MPEGFLTQEEIDALLNQKGQENGSTSEEKLPAEELPENLELILDFPLKVSVQLGKVKKKLREIRQLSPGMVVELERPINEPVDIYVGGKLIARGEVVVVDENLAVKITHIVEPVERIKKLG